MNVLLISQCDKRALAETRRILDQFAERRGDRTWQTPITQAGLDTLRRLLRKSARKNTAVACHWIRGLDHSELIWIVGDAGRFNSDGAVPTNFTRRNVLRAGEENHWHHLPAIAALAALAALMHDLGKATQAFQDRLSGKEAMGRNLYRHEWVSVRLFQAFVGECDDSGWLQRLSACANEGVDVQAFEALWLDHAGGRLLRDGEDEPAASRHLPFHSLPPLAQAVAWLILTHHRLPCKPVPNKATTSDEDIETDRRQWRRFGARPRVVDSTELPSCFDRLDPDWNEPRDGTDSSTASYWQFPHGLPVRQPAWRKQAARCARKLLALPSTAQNQAWLDDPFAAHVARLCLMLADHHYSGHRQDSQGQPVLARKPYVQQDASLFANTTRTADGRTVLNQALGEHLLGVHAQAGLVAHALPSLAASLPALHGHRGLKKRSADRRFQWQDKAADLALGLRPSAAEHGAFIVNMASTGCGKTLGNARIMNALADPAAGLRCAFAIGLRALTHQTGRSFQHDLGLSDEQLAIHVGGTAGRALFEYCETQAESTGSASRRGLFDEGGQVLYEGHDQHPLLQRLTDDADARSLLAAPLLVCTIDHLAPATESLRGGSQIVPMLRLMTSDLVLDEPDDFDMADLPTLTRLVHWAGLLGSRVLLSSATLPPALVQGLFRAYLDGRRHHQRHRGARPSEQPRIPCLWVDEFSQVPAECHDAESFSNGHAAFVAKRCNQLARAEVRRRAEIVPVPGEWRTRLDSAARREALAQYVLQQAWRLHQDAQNHSVDPATGRHVSFGLIRMANIEPLFDVALAIYRLGAPAPGVRIHLCVYHSQFALLARSHIEQQLDTVLSRRPGEDGGDPALAHPAVRSLLDGHAEPHHLFIVLASPVAEVGRDHDYDWAVVEPSSMRSLIQLAGRVRRHRPGAVGRANIAILDSNLRACENKADQTKADQAAFCKPGFECDARRSLPRPDGKRDSSGQFHLRHHDLHALLPELAAAGTPVPIDARPRIQPRNPLYPQDSLVDLEHGRMRDAMLPRDGSSKFFTPVERDASLHWGSEHRLWLTGLLPQFQRFRHDPQRREDVALLPIDDDDDTLYLHRVAHGHQRGHPEQFVDIRDKCTAVPGQDLRSDGVGPWCHADLAGVLRQWAASQNRSLRTSAEKVATASLPESAMGWWFHPALGFNRE